MRDSPYENTVWSDPNASKLIWSLVWSIQMLWIFSFHMLLLLLQGMVGIVLIGACRENESSCNLTSLSGREWIRLIEHHSKWEHEFYLSLSLFPCHSNTSQHSPSYRQSINTSGIILIRLFAARVPCHGLSIKRREKKPKKEGENLRRTEVQYRWGTTGKSKIILLLYPIFWATMRPDI